MQLYVGEIYSNQGTWFWNFRKVSEDLEIDNSQDLEIDDSSEVRLLFILSHLYA